MNSQQLKTADYLDIIFENRNKTYGAYELRKNYNSRVLKAILGTTALLVLTFLISSFTRNLKKSSTGDLDVVDTRIAKIKTETKPEVKIIKPIIKTIKPQELNKVKYVLPKIVPDKLVKEKIEEINENQTISTETVKTENTVNIIQAPVVEKGVTLTAPPTAQKNDENKIHIVVEKEAEFIGGSGAWRKFLEKNLNPQTAADDGAPAGTYKVIVKFIVSKDGSISNVEAETNFGYGMEQEAIKVIKSGPKWIPALQNGVNVNAYRSQPITFLISES